MQHRPLTGATPRIAFAVLVLAAVASCGGGSSSGPPVPQPIVSGTPSTGATPPASLAALTPAPGVPTIPPTTAPALAPVLSPSPIVGTPGPSMSPLPAPSGADLSAIVAGKPPSAAYFAAITAPATSAYVLPASAPKGIIGVIQSFVSDGFVLSVPPMETAAGATAAGAPYFATMNAVNASTVTAHASGTTLDFIPGGFARLRSGDVVVIVGSGDPSAFTMTAVTILGNSGGTTSALRRQTQTFRQPRATTPVAPARRTAVRRPRVAGTGNDTTFRIDGTLAAPAFTFPTVPTSVTAVKAGCVSVYATPSASIGFGHTANYPMVLQDVSDGTYLESQTVSLPLRLVNNGPASTPTYQIAYGLGISVGLNVVLTGCDPTAPNASTTYPISIMTIGQVQSAQTFNALPGLGSHDDIGHTSCPFIPLSFGSKVTGMDFLVNSGWSPSISFCADFVLVGNTLRANATVTNATLTSASLQSSDEEWTWISNSDDGNPNVMLIPDAAADGSIQANTVQLESMRYAGSMDATNSLQIGIAGGSFPITNGVQVVDSVFGSAAGGVSPDIADPDPITIVLTPHSSNINVIGK